MPIDQHGDATLDGVSLRSLPKISLHDHLDGAVRPDTIVELADAAGLPVPESDGDDLADWFAESSDSGSLVEYLKTFDLTTSVMQTRENLTRISREFVEDLAADGVIYGEVRWAPEQHLSGGLSLEEVVEAVQEGIEEGEDAAAPWTRLGRGRPGGLHGIRGRSGQQVGERRARRSLAGIVVRLRALPRELVVRRHREVGHALRHPYIVVTPVTSSSYDVQDSSKRTSTSTFGAAGVPVPAMRTGTPNVVPSCA